jgi:hypothetical protein
MKLLITRWKIEFLYDNNAPFSEVYPLHNSAKLVHVLGHSPSKSSITIRPTLFPTETSRKQRVFVIIMEQQRNQQQGFWSQFITSAVRMYVIYYAINYFFGNPTQLIPGSQKSVIVDKKDGSVKLTSYQPAWHQNQLAVY